jgi:alkylation response protein AidB-like acyl-CoA dehydrogenase
MTAEPVTAEPAGHPPTPTGATAAVPGGPAELERRLGDPSRPGSRLSYEAVLAAEQRGELVPAALAELAGAGLPAALIPTGVRGSGMGSVADSFALLRVVARRDPQLAVAYGSTFLGAVPVWLFADPGQQQWLAGQVALGALGACAISERAHGSDLGRNEFRADRAAGAFALTGEKWPVGNGGRAAFVTVLAGTGDHAFSLLLLDKAQLPATGWRCLPRAATIGLRGHDLSGLTFDACRVPERVLVGTAGTGLAQVLKTLQVTRPLVSGISLGVLDAALRLTIGYARARHLYGAPLSAHPAIREVLVRAYLTLLINEAVAVPIARAVSATPGRLHRWSAVAKYLVPALTEQALAELATVLSARWYIQDERLSQAFYKLQRDHAAMGIFDGTSQVSLAAVAASGAGLADPADDAGSEQVRGTLFGWQRPAPVWQPSGEALRLAAHGPDEIVDGWAAGVAAVAGDDRSQPARDLLVALEGWHSVRARYQAELRHLAATAPPGQVPARGLRLARIHCLFHAAASCLHAWQYGRHRLPGGLAGPGALTLCLQRLRQELDGEQELSPRYVDGVEQLMHDQYDRGVSFSLDPYPLGS